MRLKNVYLKTKTHNRQFVEPKGIDHFLKSSDKKTLSKKFLS